MKQVSIILILAIAAASCRTVKPKPIEIVEVIKDSVVQQEQPVIRKACPNAVLYKTKRNYYNLVPVELSEDKKSIISFPDPKNLTIETGFPLPFPLGNNYFLDNKGIGLNVGFLKLTYEEYSKLEKAPVAEELYELLMDKDPLYEMCDCGLKSNFEEPIIVPLNRMIDSNVVRTKCKVLK